VEDPFGVGLVTANGGEPCRELGPVPQVLGDRGGVDGLDGAGR
jgi:hypothetical protein